MIKSARRHPKKTVKVTGTVQARRHVRRAHPPHRHPRRRTTTRRGTEGGVGREGGRGNVEKTTAVVKGRGHQVVVPSQEKAADTVPLVARVREGHRVNGPTPGVLQCPVGVLVQEVPSFVPPQELWN